MRAHLLYALAWASFGLGHSLLAADAVKGRLRPWLGAAYRLAYNLLAAAHIGAVLLLGHALLGGGAAFVRPLPLVVAQAVVQVLGWGLLLLALRGYDLGRLGGLAQWRGARAGVAVDDEEALSTSGLHAYVRHPLYAAALLILIGRVSEPLTLATGLWGGLYLMLGARYEERRLLARFGAAYADYRRRVPAFIPWRGRVT